MCTLRALPLPLAAPNHISDKWMLFVNSTCSHANGWHTWVVTNIRVDCKFPDIEGLNDICVPFPSVFNVVENVVHGLSWHVLAHHPTLRTRDTGTERQCSFWDNEENVHRANMRESQTKPELRSFHVPYVTLVLWSCKAFQSSIQCKLWSRETHLILTELHHIKSH